MHYTYLLLILFTLSYPLFKSFEDKIQFHNQWRFLFPSIIFSAVCFSAWDVWFTHIGIWQFNPKYILNIYFINLPIEEWLFFIVTPFACVFIYEVMNFFVKKDVLKKYSIYITNLLILLSLAILAIHFDRLYTLILFALLAVSLFIHQYIIKSAYLGRFYLAWAVCIVPFLIVNGVLTGMPVVTYNTAEISDIYIFTIPIEDLFYGMINVLLVISIYEWLRKKNKALQS